jgi:hypothetical protein
MKSGGYANSDDHPPPFEDPGLGGYGRCAEYGRPELPK